MRTRRRRAVDLLLSYPPDRVAEMLGLTLTTLESWMNTDSFKSAIRAREQEQKRSLARISRQAAVNAAETLCEVAADRAKPDSKVLLELLKASGAFEADPEDPAAAMDEVMRQIREELTDAK